VSGGRQVALLVLGVRGEHVEHRSITFVKIHTDSMASGTPGLAVVRKIRNVEVGSSNLSNT
jgi:hypothetical protein